MLIFNNLTSFLFPVKKSGINNKISIESILNKQSKIRIWGNNNKIYIDKSCIIEHTCISIIGNNSTIVIEDDFCIRQGVISIEGNNSIIYIKKSTTIRGAKILAKENNVRIDIGEDCMFSDNVVIRTSDGHSLIDDFGKRLNPAESVFIGKHVWLAQSVAVLKGCTIGDHSVIGYGAVCTGDIPDKVVAVGIPARVVKNNITWTRECQ